jgi:regulator of sigma E protease
MLSTVLSFVLTLVILIVVHEWGHYAVARLCGVKVLRFSIGFGKVLLRWQPRPSGTEFVVCALPLGGYVRMLDEREAPVPEADKAQAFNTQSLLKRSAIVAAGPFVNLLLAVCLYAAVAWVGVQTPQALLSTPLRGSLAEQLGMQGGEQVVQVGRRLDELVPIQSFEALQSALLEAAVNGDDFFIETLPKRSVADAEPSVRAPHIYRLNTRELSRLEPGLPMLQAAGIVAPFSKPVLGELVMGGPAQQAGLQRGDLVLAVNGKTVVDAEHLRQLIRGSAATAPSQAEMPTQLWQIERRGRWYEHSVTPQWVKNDKANAQAPAYGRVGAYIGSPPAMLEQRYDLIDSLSQGVKKTWDLSALSLQMMGKMLIGQASLKNLSGPLTIADYAGQSASLGLLPYILFLAAISVSLGVLNLLPIPMLDGGHLMYYLYEAVSGRAPSEVWQDRLQRGGSGLLILMMMLAFYNDLIRLF